MRILIAAATALNCVVSFRADAALFGSGTEPIANFENLSVTARTGAPPSVAQVRDAIIAAGIRAGQDRDWVFTEAGPNRLIGILRVRDKHQVEVNVSYDSMRYSVVYRGSNNMRYSADDSTIHVNYNKWVSELIAAINARLGGITPQPGQAPAPVAEAPTLRPVAALATALPTLTVNRAASEPGNPQPGDTWVYQLVEPKRIAGPKQRSMTVTVARVSESEIVDQMYIDGETTTSSIHPRGRYLLTQGTSLFSPYLATFGDLPLAGSLGEVRNRDAACENAYTCVARAKIIGRETVTVPAGQFVATKVLVEQNWYASSVGSNPLTASSMAGGRTLTVWYAPEIKRAVKYSSRPIVGDIPPIEPYFDVELVKYQLK